MRMIPLLLALVLCVGCQSLKFTVHPPDGGPATEVEAMTAGRSCIVCEADPATGKIDCRLAQDASSDWVWGRIIPSIAQAAIAFFTGRGGDSVFSEPSDVGGCDSLFATEPDQERDPEKTEPPTVAPDPGFRSRDNGSGGIILNAYPSAEVWSL